MLVSKKSFHFSPCLLKIFVLEILICPIKRELPVRVPRLFLIKEERRVRGEGEEEKRECVDFPISTNSFLSDIIGHVSEESTQFISDLTSFFDPIKWHQIS